MMFFWSELSTETGKSRTLGAHLGEKKGSLDLLRATLVEFATINPHGSNEMVLIIKFIIKYTNEFQ